MNKLISIEEFVARMFINFQVNLDSLIMNAEGDFAYGANNINFEDQDLIEKVKERLGE